MIPRTESTDWSTFGSDRPKGWIGRFDGQSLTFSGDSAFGLASTFTTQSITVHFDGLLLNHDELAGQLADGRQPPASEAELLERGYRRWGLEVFEHMEGCYAVLIWDAEQHHLLAVRDPTGVFPLFYTRPDGEWLFSTSMARLLEQPGVSHTVNRLHLISWISFVWSEEDETTYEQISRVPIGHQLMVRPNGHTRLFRYWWPISEPGEIDWVTPSELPRFSELFERAVGQYLELGRAGIFLSGGIDSVSVAAYATDISRRANQPLPLALSLGFTHPDANEESVQKSVARQLGLPQQYISFDDLVDGRGIVRESLELAATFPTITANTWQPAYTHLGKLGKEAGADVILTGSGGDEWLGVTPYYAYDLIRKGQIGGLWRLWAAYARSLHISHSRSAYNLLWRFGARPLVGDAGAAVLSRTAPGLLQARHRKLWLAKWPSWLAPDPELRAQLDERVNRLIEEFNQRRKIKSYYVRELWSGIVHPLISNDHEIAYEEGRRTGVPKLSPFHNATVVRFLLRVPPNLLNRGDRTKGLMRTELARRFPDLGFEGQKKVLTTRYFEEVIFPESRRLWGETGQGKALDASGIVDRQGLLQHLEHLNPNDQQSHWHLMYFLHVDNWLRSRSAAAKHS